MKLYLLVSILFSQITFAVTPETFVDECLKDNSCIPKLRQWYCASDFNSELEPKECESELFGPSFLEISKKDLAQVVQFPIESSRQLICENKESILKATQEMQNVRLFQNTMEVFSFYKDGNNFEVKPEILTACLIAEHNLLYDNNDSVIDISLRRAIEVTKTIETDQVEQNNAESIISNDVSNLFSLEDDEEETDEEYIPSNPVTQNVEVSDIQLGIAAIEAYESISAAHYVSSIENRSIGNAQINVGYARYLDQVLAGFNSDPEQKQVTQSHLESVIAPLMDERAYSYASAILGISIQAYARYAGPKADPNLREYFNIQDNVGVQCTLYQLGSPQGRARKSYDEKRAPVANYYGTYAALYYELAKQLIHGDYCD